jgi:putative oxidoreductase
MLSSHEANDASYGALILLSRILLSLPFLYSGIDKSWRWTAAQREVAASRLPWPTLLHLATVLLQLAGGLSILIGMEARLGALLLCIFLIPVTLIYHPFWRRSGPDFVAEADHFLLNFAFIGGLLMILALGSGPISVIDHSPGQLLETIAAAIGITR